MRPAAWRRKRGAIGILPLAFAGREVAADIALSERAVDGVAEGVDADIGIGMAVESELEGGW